MRIAVKNGKDGKWKRIPNRDQQEDSYIQDLIYQVPELISIEDLEPGEPSLKVCIKNPSADGSAGDGGVIGVDENGRITIVECGIANDSSRKEIMGQAMEYAATLWEMSYEEFDGMVLNSEGRSLVELMRERVPAEEWSEEEFRNAVTSALQHGKFRLIMTVKSLTNGLRRTMNFLNARGPFSFETYVVEMQYFTDGEVDIVIPRTISPAEREQKTSTERTMPPQAPSSAVPNAARPERPTKVPSSAESTVAGPEQPTESPSLSKPTVAQPPRQSPERDEQKEASFFAKCRGNVSENALGLIRKLHTFSMEVADNIMWWGAGGAGAFNFVLTEDELTVFVVDANGKIMFNFFEWQGEPIYKALLPQFIEKLKGITILRDQQEDYTRWSDFNVEQFFANPGDFTTFEESIRFLKAELSNRR
jgi:hypothetical protein